MGKPCVVLGIERCLHGSEPLERGASGARGRGTPAALARFGRRVILAGIVWLDAPVPSGGLGKVWERWDHWLALADERFSLHNSGAVKAAQALGTIEIHVDFSGSFEPYTLRLPDEVSKLVED